MTTYNIAIMVRNEYGVLNRVTSMFRRRQFNILSLTVSETETEQLSRITVQYESMALLHDTVEPQVFCSEGGRTVRLARPDGKPYAIVRIEVRS